MDLETLKQHYDTIKQSQCLARTEDGDALENGKVDCEYGQEYGVAYNREPRVQDVAQALLQCLHL